MDADRLQTHAYTGRGGSGTQLDFTVTLLCSPLFDSSSSALRLHNVWLLATAEVCKHRQRCSLLPAHSLVGNCNILHAVNVYILSVRLLIVIILPHCVIRNNRIKPAKGPFAPPGKRWRSPPTPAWSGTPGTNSCFKNDCSWIEFTKNCASDF